MNANTEIASQRNSCFPHQQKIRTGGQALYVRDTDSTLKLVALGHACIEVPGFYPVAYVLCDASTTTGTTEAYGIECRGFSQVIDCFRRAIINGANNYQDIFLAVRTFLVTGLADHGFFYNHRFIGNFNSVVWK